MKRKISLIFFIFLFSMTLRLWNVNQMGRTWDESAYVDVGNNFVKLIEKGDLLNSFFYKWSDEPPLARYVYGLFSKFDEHKGSNGNLLNYDYTYARLASSLVSTLAVVVVVLFALEFLSFSVALVAGLVLSMLPVFLGYSQIATLESFIIFTFSASVYAFIRFLINPTYKNSVITGVFVGLAVLSKITNLLLLPLFLAIFVIWRISSIQKNKKLESKKSAAVFLSSLITFFSIWPMPLFNLQYTLATNFALRSKLGTQPSIEVFFGKLIHLPVYYYLIFFLITTPIVIVVLFLIGAKYISDYGSKFDKLKTKERNKNIKWIFYSLIIWFCIPFLQSFYNFRHQGVRFIIEIYAPLAIITALGFNYLVNKLTKNLQIKIILTFFLFSYLFIIICRLTPYYFDYYNIIVGGNKTVYEKGLFQFGWWGEGIREAGYYIKENVPKESRIGLAISPVHVFPPLAGYKIYNYEKTKRYDYVVLNSFHVLREGFDDSEITKNYTIAYEVKADGAVLVFVYKHK